jgi:hypothetical protein
VNLRQWQDVPDTWCKAIRGCWKIKLRRTPTKAPFDGAVHIQLVELSGGPRYILNPGGPGNWKADRIGPEFLTLEDAVSFCEFVERAGTTLTVYEEAET